MTENDLLGIFAFCTLWFIVAAIVYPLARARDTRKHHPPRHGYWNSHDWPIYERALWFEILADLAYLALMLFGGIALAAALALWW